MTRTSEIPPERLKEMTPAVRAFVVMLLSSMGRLSQRMIAALLRDLFDLTISDGQISRLQRIGRKAMQAGYEEIVEDVRSSAAASECAHSNTSNTPSKPTSKTNPPPNSSRNLTSCERLRSHKHYHPSDAPGTERRLTVHFPFNSKH